MVVLSSVKLLGTSGMALKLLMTSAVAKGAKRTRRTTVLSGFARKDRKDLEMK
jgi:hypothetical protein